MILKIVGSTATEPSKLASMATLRKYGVPDHLLTPNQCVNHSVEKGWEWDVPLKAYHSLCSSVYEASQVAPTLCLDSGGSGSSSFEVAEGTILLTRVGSQASVAYFATHELTNTRFGK